jgi:general secretion pathway protein H
MPTSSGRLTARVLADSSELLLPPETSKRGWRNAFGAFTLLEILVTIALIALLSAILIAGAGKVLADRPTTPSDVFRKALSEARRTAVEKNVEVRLSFDAKTKAFVALSDDGTQNYPADTGGDLNVDFLSPQKGGSAILVGGELVETQTLPFVTFYPDGTCSPFKVQIRTDNGTASITAIDPWTCAPVLPADKKETP